MYCKICNNKLDISNVTCSTCNEEFIIIDNKIIDSIITQYQKYCNLIIQYNKTRYDDNYKTLAIKRTKLEVFQEIKRALETILENDLNINLKNIEIEEYSVIEPTICQLNKNKICNHCMNC